jgi:hypothetical protein
VVAGVRNASNHVLPINPCALQTISTSRKTASTSLPRVATKCARVVKCGRWSQARAMKITFSTRARAIVREEVMPREEANNTTLSNTAGS